jgi:8-oxo-dGTP diphosphatase
MPDREYIYCPRCGSKLGEEERFGRLRPVCPQCGWVYFADPKVAVAVLVERENKILLVRRGNEPYRGLWTLPAGFVDAGESPTIAAVRECFEETGLHIRIVKLLDVIAGQEHPHGAHILIAYRGEIISGEIKPGDDAEGAGFFPRQALPPLAFVSTTTLLSI